MNGDRIKGNLKEAAGKVQEKFGELIDSPEQEAKGQLRQAEGVAQQKLGDAKEVAEDFTKKNL